ncbi:hypothetical protein BBN63_29525 [Streptomyces niveus]|uniref:Uncharacterized protein n=1 Tax=Streptomyces niveus TaxID=193462 RepID=A0A1U9QZM4_STRNV|nr:hypothetical protein BBN63_29525 [Streptomyces niveus]
MGRATGCGTRYEELTADGQGHVDYALPFGESYSEGDDNPICHCPRLPKQFCMACAWPQRPHGPDMRLLPVPHGLGLSRPTMVLAHLPPGRQQSMETR